MESIPSKSKEKSGAQKIREKRAKELDIAGKDPKQMKLSFAVGHGTTVPKERPTEVCTDQDRLPVRQDMLAKELDIAGKDPKQMKLSFAVGHGATVPKERPTEVCTDQDRLPVRQDVLVQEELRTHSPNSLIEELDFESSSEMTIIEKSPIPCSEATSLHDLESGRTEEESSSSDVQFDTTKTVFSLPSICSIAEKIAFVQMHPVQPSTTDCEGLPFKEIDFYFRRNPNGDLIRRSWLTCRVNNRKIEAFFCSICIAFSNSTSSFTSGCTNFRHCYQVANKHETSKTHREAVNTYFTITKSRGIDTLINQAHASKRKKEILQNIEVMKRIFDIVKLLAKQGLPFRAHGTNESLYNLSNAEINHGNFLEMVLFLSNYDVPLKNHIRKCISESERRKKQRRLLGKQTAGRGSLVTFLSYNTVKKVIMAIVQTMKSSIVSEIGEKRFSIQVDSTQDVGVVDQATVVVRYVKEESVKERLISVLPVKDSSGRGLNELLMSSFQILGLDYKKIAGESFDGAANMRSAYVGLRAQIAKEVPNAVYIWCYSHILNLCISDCCDVLEAKKFFGLLHRLATFIGDSHKRMNVWRDQLDKRCGHEKLLRLQKIGETRWWAKDKALHWLFGEKHSLFLDTLEVLLLISQFKQSDSKTTSEAASLSENLCLFKTILTAHLFLSIFDVIGPVSRYLQTSGLDYMVAWRMVESTVDQLKKIEFSYIQEKAKQFAKKINDLITEREGLDSLEVESELQERRIGRKKRMPGESSIDERPISETQRFRVEVFRPILDQIIGSLDERFSENKQLVQDSQYLDPRFFDKIRKDPNVLEAGALQRISQLSNVDESGLKTELQSFANLFPHLREQESGKVDMVPISCQQEEDDDDDDYLDNNPVNTDDDDWGSCTVDSMEQETKCKSCNKCFLYCHRFLVKYNLFSSAYENLSVVYEYLLTLSYTQVACERAFSKLKLIKTRLRATMGQELLDALMIMSVERDLLELVQFQDVLEKIRKTSPLMRSLLTV